MLLEKKKLEVKQILQSILFAFLVFIIPCLNFTILAWVHFLTPLVVFIYIIRFGQNVGNKFILTGLIAATVISLVLGAISSILFTLTLLPLGYVVAQSSSREQTPVLTGLKGVLTQAISWLIYGFTVSSIRGKSIYQDIVESFTIGINSAIDHYRLNENLPADTQVAIEQTFYQLKIAFPIVLPSLLAVSIFLIVCTTMIAGNSLLLKLDGKQPWEPFRMWQLPDKLIWIVIGSGLFTLIEAGNSRIIGINLLIFFAVVYCFQGFSIFVFYLEKWKVPRFFKTVLYITVIFQSFGTALLITLGLSSVWINYRTLGSKKDNDNDIS